MTRIARRLLPAALLALTGGLSAQAPAPPAAPAPAAAPAEMVQVTLTTDQGLIVLALDRTHAPITTANFLRYVDGKRLDGTTFYRAVKVQPGYGLVQGGVRNAPKRVLPEIAHEPTTRTGLSHTDGTISMARAAPGTASGDFFIVVGNIPSMDAHPEESGDNQGFAAFGHVVQGMELVRRILDLPTSATDGPPGMKGQMLSPSVKILTARRS